MGLQSHTLCLFILASFIAEPIAPNPVASNNTTYSFPLSAAFVCEGLGVTAGQCWLGVPAVRFNPMLAETEPQSLEDWAALGGSLSYSWQLGRENQFLFRGSLPGGF